MEKVWLLLLLAISLPQSLTTSEGSCSKDDPNCDEPLGSVMSEAAEKSKAIDEEVDDTDEVDGVFEPCRVSQDKDGGQLHKMLMNKAGHEIKEYYYYLKSENSSYSSYPHILISSYPHILISSYPHILISSYPHILISTQGLISKLSECDLILMFVQGFLGKSPLSTRR